MQNTLPPEARLSNGYGLPESDRAEAALRRVDASLAEKAARKAKRNKGLLRGLTATALVGAGGLLHNAIDSGSSAASERPAAAHAQPSPDADLTSTPDKPLQVVVKPGDTLSDYAASIEHQPGNQDRSVEGITEDLIALNGGTSRIESPQGVTLPPYAHDMQPEKGGTQLSPAETNQPK